MTGKIKTVLFLTSSEREDVFQMMDHFLDHDMDSMEEEERYNRWAELLSKLVNGKGKKFPLWFKRDKE